MEDPGDMVPFRTTCALSNGGMNHRRELSAPLSSVVQELQAL